MNTTCFSEYCLFHAAEKGILVFVSVWEVVKIALNFEVAEFYVTKNDS